MAWSGQAKACLGQLCPGHGLHCSWAWAWDGLTMGWTFLGFACAWSGVVMGWRGYELGRPRDGLAMGFIELAVG
jgi:hypothetical protein